MAGLLHEALLATAVPAHTTGALVVSIGRPSSWVFLSRVEGHLTVDGARCIGDAARKLVAAERRFIVIFNDWSQMTDYDGAARVHLMDVARVVLPATAGIHIHITSQRVAFGVRAANLVIQKMTVHTDFDAFADALVTAVEHPTRERLK